MVARVSLLLVHHKQIIAQLDPGDMEEMLHLAKKGIKHLILVHPLRRVLLPPSVVYSHGTCIAPIRETSPSSRSILGRVV